MYKTVKVSNEELGIEHCPEIGLLASPLLHYFWYCSNLFYRDGSIFQQLEDFIQAVK